MSDSDSCVPLRKKRNKATSFHRRKTAPYTESFLQKMLGNVRNGSMSMYHVNKFYGIPRATLQYRLGQKFKNKGRSGPDSVLTLEEESEVVQWLQTMERRGFPITRHVLINRVSTFLRQNPRKNPCRDNVPGRRWLEGFMRRHSELTLRTPESVTAASAKVSEKDIRKWFQTVLDYLIEHNLVDALSDPSRILNGDETGFVMNSSPKKVLATKGTKNVSTVDTQNGKQNVTVLFSFSADGMVIPPDVILPYKRLSRDIVQSFPPDWGLGTSDTGWMNTLNFTLYIQKILYPSLVKKNVKFPVLYFVDGHKSHTALEAADACAKLDIVLIALYPNATRILQPADVSIFRPLKNSWGNVVEIWKTEHMAERLSIPMFGSLLQETMKTAFKELTIINAFRVCGLYPFNADAVDYSKCITKSHSQPEPALETTPTNIVDSLVTKVPTTAIKAALSMIGDERIDLYKYGNQNNFSYEDKVLYFIYKNILTVNQFSDCDMPCNFPVQNWNNIKFEAAITEQLAFPATEVPTGQCINGSQLEGEYLTEDTNNADTSVDPNVTLQMIFNASDDFSNVDLEAAIAEPLILLECGSEFPFTLSTNDLSTEPQYIHPSAVANDYEPSVNTNMSSPLISKATADLDKLDLFEARTELSTAQYNNYEPLFNGDPRDEDSNDIFLGAASDESLVLYEEGIKQDLQLLMDYDESQANCQDENSYNIEFLSSELNQSRETGMLESIPMNNGPSKIQAATFFKAPPTPKRNPKHRNYNQKSYAILTAGERLDEFRQMELRKAEAEEAKKKKAEERSQKKLLREAAALLRENAKKEKSVNKKVAALAKAGKEEAKKPQRKARKKKDN